MTAATPTVTEQLSALGYKLLAGSARFHTAMSMGREVIGQDQAGSRVTFVCAEGLISAKPTVIFERQAVEFQVQRIHQA